MAASRAHIMILQLGNAMQGEIFANKDLDYVAMIEKLKTKGNVVTIKTAAAAHEYLCTHNVHIVLVVDGGFTQTKYANFQARLARFAKAGGTVIFGCLFTSFCKPLEADAMFGRFEQCWEIGDYHRADFGLSPRVRGQFSGPAYGSLLSSYSMKCLHLKHVQADAKVYTPYSDSKTQSMVFAPENVDDQQCPAVFAGYGGGRLGYIGDVNNEEGSRNLTNIDTVIGTSSRRQIQSVPTTVDEPSCAVCGASSNVKRCARCHQVSYCTQLCQRADWTTHKEVCSDHAA